MVGTRFKVARSGKAAIRLKCPDTEANGPCAGSIDLKTKKSVRINGKRKKYRLGTADFSIEAGVTRSVKFRFRKPILKLLRTNPPARSAQATIKLEDGLGNQATVLKSLKAKVSG